MTESERIKRFEGAYNRIDRALEDLANRRGDNRRRPYASKVRVAADRFHRLRPHIDFLLEVGELRNAIIHNRLGDGSYIAVPNEKTVEELESIEARLFSPEKVAPRFQRAVAWFDSQTTLAEALAQMRDTGYSRFPVYENGSFIGLLTSDGFARWLARESEDGRISINGNDTRVGELLPADHRRDCVAFASRETAIDDVAEMFRDNPKLEAVVLTEHGRLSQKPIGLITPGDLVGLDA